jgi:hypothetical protein
MADRACRPQAVHTGLRDAGLARHSFGNSIAPEWRAASRAFSNYLARNCGALMFCATWSRQGLRDDRLPKGKHDDQVDSTAQFLDWFKKPFPGQGIFEYYRPARGGGRGALQTANPNNLGPGSCGMASRDEQIELNRGSPLTGQRNAGAGTELDVARGTEGSNPACSATESVSAVNFEVAGEVASRSGIIRRGIFARDIALPGSSSSSPVGLATRIAVPCLALGMLATGCAFTLAYSH